MSLHDITCEFNELRQSYLSVNPSPERFHNSNGRGRNSRRDVLHDPWDVDTKSPADRAAAQYRSILAQRLLEENKRLRVALDEPPNKDVAVEVHYIPYKPVVVGRAAQTAPLAIPQAEADAIVEELAARHVLSTLGVHTDADCVAFVGRQMTAAQMEHMKAIVSAMPPPPPLPPPPPFVPVPVNGLPPGVRAQEASDKSLTPLESDATFTTDAGNDRASGPSLVPSPRLEPQPPQKGPTNIPVPARPGTATQQTVAVPPVVPRLVLGSSPQVETVAPPPPVLTSPALPLKAKKKKGIASWFSCCFSAPPIVEISTQAPASPKKGSATTRALLPTSQVDALLSLCYSVIERVPEAEASWHLVSSPRTTHRSTAIPTLRTALANATAEPSALLPPDEWPRAALEVIGCYECAVPRDFWRRVCALDKATCKDCLDAPDTPQCIRLTVGHLRRVPPPRIGMISTRIAGTMVTASGIPVGEIPVLAQLMQQLASESTTGADTTTAATRNDNDSSTSSTSSSDEE